MVVLPVPFTLAPPAPGVRESVIQLTGLDAVQAQFEPLAVIASWPEPPVLLYGLPDRLESTVTLQGDGSWVTVNGTPPILSVPLRRVVLGLGATE